MKRNLIGYRIRGRSDERFVYLKYRLDVPEQGRIVREVGPYWSPHPPEAQGKAALENVLKAKSFKYIDMHGKPISVRRIKLIPVYLVYK